MPSTAPAAPGAPTTPPAAVPAQAPPAATALPAPPAAMLAPPPLPNPLAGQPAATVYTAVPVVTAVDTGDPANNSPTKPTEDSHFAVLMDAASGKILWYRNPNAHREIASTTKIMTAILLLERGKPGDTVVAPAGLDAVPEDSLHLKAGETITLHDLLYAMLLRSANDTAVAGADYLSGSVPAFAAAMNAKALEIGARNTHFVTPNGLYDPNHYSSAADLALFARYAVLNLPQFDEIVRTQRYRVTRSIDTQDEWVKNTSSKFLKEFPGGDGIKTGYIRQAGHCFVASATRHGWRLIAVALDSNTCREDDESILQYGFDNFQRVLALRAGDSVGTVNVPGAAHPIAARAASDVDAAISRWKPTPDFSYYVSPLAAIPPGGVTPGMTVGTIVVLAHGAVQATGYAVAAEAVGPAPPALSSLVPNAGHGGMFAGVARVVGAVMLMVLGGRTYARTVAKSPGGGRDRVAPRV